MNINVSKTPEELAGQFADQLMKIIETHSGEKFHLAISGGKTPDLLFSVLAEKYVHSELWNKVHFWWVDERMVAPDHPESNFRIAHKLLFSQISIPEENIHRIKGENDPETEANSYSAQIQEQVPLQENWPVFDLILLGMGDDGHTASIFPDQMELLHSDSICAVATHPQSGQKRVTLTGKVINRAKQLVFLVTGESKIERVSEIFHKTKEARNLPAFYIAPLTTTAEWHLDEDAAKKIS
ncbi:MAG: 6-phosphogluconolactonase [Prolixibacteraceae bacterium]